MVQNSSFRTTILGDPSQRSFRIGLEIFLKKKHVPFTDWCKRISLLRVPNWLQMTNWIPQLTTKIIESPHWTIVYKRGTSMVFNPFKLI